MTGSKDSDNLTGLCSNQIRWNW